MTVITWPLDLREKDPGDLSNVNIVLALSHANYIALNNIVSYTHEFGQEIRRSSSIESIYFRHQARIWNYLSWDIAWAAGNTDIKAIIDQRLIDQLKKVWRTQCLLAPSKQNDDCLVSNPLSTSTAEATAKFGVSDKTKEPSVTYDILASTSDALINQGFPNDVEESDVAYIPPNPINEAIVNDGVSSKTDRTDVIQPALSSTIAASIDQRVSNNIEESDIANLLPSSTAKDILDDEVSINDSEPATLPLSINVEVPVISFPDPNTQQTSQQAVTSTSPEPRPIKNATPTRSQPVESPLVPSQVQFSLGPHKPSIKQRSKAFLRRVLRSTRFRLILLLCISLGLIFRKGISWLRETLATISGVISIGIKWLLALWPLAFLHYLKPFLVDKFNRLPESFESPITLRTVCETLVITETYRETAWQTHTQNVTLVSIELLTEVVPTILTEVFTLFLAGVSTQYITQIVTEIQTQTVLVLETVPSTVKPSSLISTCASKPYLAAIAFPVTPNEIIPVTLDERSQVHPEQATSPSAPKSEPLPIPSPPESFQQSANYSSSWLWSDTSYVFWVRYLASCALGPLVACIVYLLLNRYYPRRQRQRVREYQD
ncbi:hypothetical protein PZA11_008023 [Diplocarpon coronariae]